MKHIYSLLLFALALMANGQKLEGLIVDKDTKEELPFVNVLYNARLSLGVSTDVNGKFTIEDRSLIEKLQITSIGFEPVVITLANIPKTGVLSVEMQALTTNLQEAVVKAGENPALRIIRNAIANADNNDPKKYDSYRFKSYNKNILTRNLDSLISARRQLKLMESDTASVLSNRYLLMSETVSQTRFKKPNLFKEEIIGTKISGFKKSIMAVGAENIQYFGLYDDVIQVLTEFYITPLAKGSDKRYFFILQDTVIKGTDSTYIMYFQPRMGANFEGLKGEIHINTNGWAMEYIFAEPNYKSTVDFAMEHYYQQLPDGNWFPMDLGILLQLEQMPFFNDPGFVYSQLFVDSVEINIPLADEQFDHVKRELTVGAPDVTDEFWEKYRPAELNLKESKTYAHMDSIGERYKFDFMMNGLRNIYRGFFTVGDLELKVNKFLAYTGYEGLRLGAGVYTNSQFSKKIRFGGYYGYGFTDKKWKYGGTAEYFFNWKKDHKLTLDYSDDVTQPGVVNIPYYYNTNFWTEVWAQHMDRKKEVSLTYKTRLANFMTLEVGVRKFDLLTNNTYRYFNTSDADATPTGNFNFSEANLEWRWAYKEMITSNFGHQISAGSDYPVVMVKYAKGFDGVAGGNFNYNKVEVGAWLYRYLRGWGFLDTRIEAGYVDQSLPYQMLFSNRTSYNPAISIVNKNSFQTMRFNEFFADKYVSLFLNHNFGSLLFRTNWFQPEISINHAMSFGTMSNPQYHQNIQFKTLEKGYYESGVIISNILHIDFFKVGYIGFGVGAFYRYGPYTLPNEHENWAAKLSIIYTIN